MRTDLVVLLTVATLLAAASPAVAEERIVILKNGRRVRGEVEEVGDHVKVKTAGGWMMLARSDVARTEAAPVSETAPERKAPQPDLAPAARERTPRAGTAAISTVVDAAAIAKLLQRAMTADGGADARRRLSQLGPQGAVMVIDRLAVDPALREQRAVIFQLVAPACDGRAAKSLVALLLVKDLEPPVKADVLKVLLELRSLEAVPALVAMFAVESVADRALAAVEAALPEPTRAESPPRALAGERLPAPPGHGEAVIAIRRGIASNDQRVSVRAARAFSRLVANTDATLLAALHDSRAPEAETVAYLNGLTLRAGREVLDDLLLGDALSHLGATRPPVRAAAATLAGRARARDRVPQLIELLGDEDAASREAALRGLREISGIKTYVSVAEWTGWWKSSKAP